MNYISYAPMYELSHLELDAFDLWYSRGLQHVIGDLTA